MKFLSLETKKHLIAWSLILSAGIIFILNLFSYERCVQMPKSGPFLDIYSNCNSYSGIPLAYKVPDPSSIGLDSDMIGKLLINLGFWFVVSLIILSLFRHFKRKINV